MFYIGCHLSSSKGFLAMGKEAVRIGATTFQFFTRNPRGGAAKKLDKDDLAAYRDFAGKNGIGEVVAHASYTLNPATTEERLRKFVRETVADDLSRLEHMPGALYNIHPGSRRDSDPGEAVKTVAVMLDSVIKPKQTTTVLLETMSGKGSEMGGTFEELRAIIDASKRKKSLGVCIDTCHIFDAGYDIVGDLDAVLGHFDKVVGLDRLKAIHLNDSMNALGSKKDRHAKLGEGKIGWDAFARIINHPALRDLPFVLETPNDVEGYGREIAALKKVRVEKGKKK